MSDTVSPFDVGVAAAGVAALVVAVAVSAVSRRYPSQASRASQLRAKRLPRGAEAALLSILEAIPDPRNHLALTRDLSGEVRITDADRETFRAGLEQQRGRRPRSAELSRFVPVRDEAPAPPRRRAKARRSPQRDESLVLTGQIFDDA